VAELAHITLVEFHNKLPQTVHPPADWAGDVRARYELRSFREVREEIKRHQKKLEQEKEELQNRLHKVSVMLCVCMPRLLGGRPRGQLPAPCRPRATHRALSEGC
jgi:hypothetical protein